MPQPTTNAPSDPFFDAPTAAIHTVVTGMRLESRSTFAARTEIVSVRLQDDAGTSYREWPLLLNPVADVTFGDLTFLASDGCDLFVPPWDRPDPSEFWRDVHWGYHHVDLPDETSAGRASWFETETEGGCSARFAYEITVTPRSYPTF